MKEYRKVIEFIYKNKKYNMYLDKNNKHFFLENINDELSYIKFEELIELTRIFNNTIKIMKIEKEKPIRFIPKVFLGGTLVALSGITLATGCELLKTEQKQNTTIETTTSIEEYISTTDYKEPKKLEIDTFVENENLNYIYIYDMDYLDKIFKYKSININQIKETIKNNRDIPEKYKNILYEYCDALNKKYPNIEKRVFFENLKTLKVVECTKEQMIQKTISVDSYGCYIKSENVIYVLKNNEYKKGTWEYQILFHEFSHCLRTYDRKEPKKIRVEAAGLNFQNTITEETLNSLFAVSLFDYEEKDIAYQLQSNYTKIMVDCLDNYSLEDYVQHSLSYYAKKLDEYNNDENRATVILELIQIQYQDYHGFPVKINHESYDAILDYISEMYYKKYINNTMTYEEAKMASDKLLKEIMYDVPEDYNINTKHFEEYFNNYYNNINTKTR